MAVLGGVGLAAAGRLRGRLRTVVAAVVTLAMFALCLLAGGIADEHLRPDHWGELLGGIGRGLEALPGINVPYQGTDEWTRVVLGAGGTALMAGATALALWPRRARLGLPARGARAAGRARGGARRRARLRGRVRAAARCSACSCWASCGWRSCAAATCRPPPRSAWPRRSPRSSSRPRFDGRQPVVGLRELGAVGLDARARPAFSWDHEYCPLDWPRDGRELLRVRASPARVLEGPEPRHLRRRALASATRERGADRAGGRCDPSRVGRWSRRSG